MVAFVRNCLVKMTLRLFYPISVVMTVVMTMTKDTGVVHQLTKTDNFIATPMKKHI